MLRTENGNGQRQNLLCVSSTETKTRKKHMKLSELKQTLAQHSDKTLRFVLPTGSKIPAHAHVTEVARLDKRFVDCGGTFRTESSCRLQAWFSDDTEHRLTAGKLLSIFNKGARILETEDLEVEVEYEAPFIAQFPVSSVEPNGESVLVRLGTKHTACLAEDKCGVSPSPTKQTIGFKPLPKLETEKCCA